MPLPLYSASGLAAADMQAARVSQLPGCIQDGVDLPGSFDDISAGRRHNLQHVLHGHDCIAGYIAGW
jgi:hypothetical protein